MKIKKLTDSEQKILNLFFEYVKDYDDWYTAKDEFLDDFNNALLKYDGDPMTVFYLHSDDTIKDLLNKSNINNQLGVNREL